MIRLSSDDAVPYLLRDQYADITDDETRDNVLEAITTQLVNDVFGGDLPGPRGLAATLGPAMAEGRMVIWSRHQEDQPLLQRLGIAGDLPAPDGDGLAVVSTNGGANKLDAYLRRSIGYDARVDEGTGRIESAVTIRLASDAPTDLPSDAGGNPFGLPPGTNRQYLSVYSPWELTGAELDGEATGMEPGHELGWNVFSRFVDIPPGGEVEVRLRFAGRSPPTRRTRSPFAHSRSRTPTSSASTRGPREGTSLIRSHEPRFGVDRLAADNFDPRIDSARRLDDRQKVPDVRR